jgi:lipopolysaccharide transport system ATP-binding protein
VIGGGSAVSEIAIRVEGLAKQYRIGRSERYKTLRESLAGGIAAPARALWSTFGHKIASAEVPNTIWALKDVEFEVKRGEVVGIIGRNGAGKSTLLKILSRVTEPTEGLVDLHGRVASLLEVGTGFHPELTGRENVYLNGSILGMRKAEIERKFDEIVAFAEIEKFLDTQVKHYSSGMYMRLAFSVAAHLEPEILIVDEVLAVGDSAFQKKCLGKMGEVSRQGRTVLFVSHQTNQIRRLSDTVVWLDGGGMRQIGPSARVIAAYDASLNVSENAGASQSPADSADARFVDWEIVTPVEPERNVLQTIGPIAVRFRLSVRQPIRNGHSGIALFNADNQLIWATAVDNLDLAPGAHSLVYRLPFLPLRPGPYQWHVSLLNNGARVEDWYCTPHLVVATQPLTHPREEWQGILNLPWEFDLT